MKTSLVIAMLIIMASTQTTINPRTQACVCSNLLNSFDCGGHYQDANGHLQMLQIAQIAQIRH